MSHGARSAAWPAASTRPVAVLGWPVRHSLSPLMHNAAFAELDLDLAYLALPVPPERFAEVVAALGAVEALGANVTVPHKLAAAEVCDVLTEEARLIGAVNTLHWTDEGLLGDNTDATGLRDAIARDVAPAAGAPALLIGTGGAARAAAVAAGRLGVRVVVAGRRPEAAVETADLARAAGAPEVEACDLRDEQALAEAVADARLVVNTTPLGMAGESLPAPCHRLTEQQVAYDLIYTPARTPFLADAEARGASAYNGLGMLVGQAAASFERWTGRAAPQETMLAAAQRALAERQ